MSGAPAHSTSCTSGGSSRQARRNSGSPFWRVIRPTKTTDGRSGSTPCARTRSGSSTCDQSRCRCRCARRGPCRVDVGVGVRARRRASPPTPRSPRRRRGTPSARRSDETAYPPPSCSAFHGPQRLEGVRGDDVRDVVQQPGEVAAQVGVPGVGVHQVGAGAAGGHREVDAEGLQRGVGVGELRQVGVRRDARPRRAARRTPAPGRRARAAPAAPAPARRRAPPRRRRSRAGTPWSGRRRARRETTR